MRILLLIIGLLMIEAACAQTTSRKAQKLYDESDYLIKRRQYPEAVEVLKQALAKDEEFVAAHIRIAGCYKILDQYKEAAYHYERALLHGGDKVNVSVYLNLGELLFLQGRYADASARLEVFLDKYDQKNGRPAKARQLLGSARFAEEKMQEPLDFDPRPLDETINRFALQYFPVLTADEKSLIFTRRENVGPQYDEDIYVSVKDENGRWTTPGSISPAINSEFNEGTCAISADGRMLIFTSCLGRKTLGSCDLFVSYKTGDEWSKPENLGASVNSAAWESQPSLSADGRTLYFISDRYGGQGKRDIWMSHKDSDGQWTDAVNLGPSVNTPDDEVSPFLHANGRTLYFASKGYEGFGGFDLYYSERAAEGWTEPVNLGYPVNTHEDQVSLFVTPDGSKGYYAVDEKRGGLLVSSKLYEFDVPEEIKVSAPSGYIAGKVYDSETKEPLDARVELFDLAGDTLVSVAGSDPRNGSYMMVLTEGSEYALYVDRPGYIFKSMAFNYKRSGVVQSLYKDIPLDPVREGVVTTLSNVFFEHDSYKLQPKSVTELNKAVAFLNNNPGVKVEVAGHTDDTGTPEYNRDLSVKRARAVYDFLTENGISEERLRYKGYGQESPKAPNTSEANRALNRRIEFMILEY